MKDTYIAELVTESDEFGYLEWKVEYEATIASDGIVDFEPLDLDKVSPVTPIPFYALMRARFEAGFCNEAETQAMRHMISELDHAYIEAQDGLADKILTGAAERKAYSEAEARADFPALFTH